ncbi:hypothetical protein NADFUDRAFT_39886 [Nadsonia fulvescens var. elongata DSM 6958]|uniref:Uncharacterized protein n=1 Tax=Nadsonia fulvescens var. elongata DSM 6958 TaxID=857566 RepID=A0A1E3PSW0_9ASCO|nr:hypothetical protein NADFUDRAFT_39886 [Nadsonia fulvescens var. elongata DSM 6958]
MSNYRNKDAARVVPKVGQPPRNAIPQPLNLVTGSTEDRKNVYGCVQVWGPINENEYQASKQAQRGALANPISLGAIYASRQGTKPDQKRGKRKKTKTKLNLETLDPPTMRQTQKSMLSNPGRPSSLPSIVPSFLLCAPVGKNNAKIT